MKKLLCLLVALLLAFSMIACTDKNGGASGENGGEENGENNGNNGSDVWWGDDGLETPIIPA